MTVTVTVKFFSANGSCRISVIPSDHGSTIVESNSTYIYDDLDDTAYSFIFRTTNPEGGRIKIEVLVNGKMYRNIEITKTGERNTSLIVKP